ncbi:MAG: hypothetical protein P4N59_11840 [Negativicutes bacterium]|nr:hypothetical protein [Negativicutes bacterium]
MMPSTMEELEKIRKECYSIVKKRALASAGANLVPVPGAGVSVDVGMLLELIPRINKKFGLSPEDIELMDAEVKIIILNIIKQMGTNLIGQAITKDVVIQVLKVIGKRMAVKEVTKYVPVAGQAATALISYFAMKYVGDSHVDECYQVVKQLVESKCEAAATIKAE